MQEGFTSAPRIVIFTFNLSGTSYIYGYGIKGNSSLTWSSTQQTGWTYPCLTTQIAGSLTFDNVASLTQQGYFTATANGYVCNLSIMTSGINRDVSTYTVGQTKYLSMSSQTTCSLLMWSDKNIFGI